MKTVLTYGTFDLFHVGHVNLLKRLSQLGDQLIVGVSSDEFNAVKGKHSVVSFQDRKKVLESCKYVSKVFAENDWGQKRADIIAHKADIFAMGDDWTGKFDDLQDLCEVIYLPRTPDISTTSIKQYLSAQHEDKLKSAKLLMERAVKELSAI